MGLSRKGVFRVGIVDLYIKLSVGKSGGKYCTYTVTYIACLVGKLYVYRKSVLCEHEVI